MRGGEYAAVGHSRSRCQQIGAHIQARAVPEGVAPARSATHIHLSFLKIHELRSAVVEDARHAEMAVIFRVVERFRGFVGELQCARRSRFLLGSVEIYIYPMSFPFLVEVGGGFILHLPRHHVLSRLNA